jgi:hypothetical protein
MSDQRITRERCLVELTPRPPADAVPDMRSTMAGEHSLSGSTPGAGITLSHIT